MIRLSHISKVFHTGNRTVHALDDVSLHVPAGQIFGVIGASGAGKSTLIRCVNLLERPSSGEVVVDGRDMLALSDKELTQARRHIGMIFQHFNLLSSKTVANNVAMPLKLAGELSKAQIKVRVAELLARVGLSDHANKYPAQLSGGQKQRVGIARALATDPKILLCDEATSALDPQTTGQVLQLLAEINRELGLTIVLITHEMDVIRRVCDRVGVMDGGVIVESGLVSDVFLHPQHPTTQNFVQESEGDADLSPDAEYQQVSGRIVRLTFLGEATYAPLLGQVARDTGVDYSILAGRIGRIKDQACGQLTLALTGGKELLAEQQLRAAGVHVEVLRP